MRIRNRSRAALVSLVSLDLLAASAAYAQSTAASDNIEEVVVTGFRASLADALENKRESNQMIESVSAEDIGKFPDQNIAESLQRLSGVQIDRSNGQGTKVRIRGLDQNVTLLDGDIFLTGLELYTQGEGNTRETDSLEGIPSELLGGVDVYKSPTAAQLEGGLGGIVNLKTRNPFDLQGDTTLAGNARYGDSGEGWEPLGALVYGQKFGDRLAVIASISYDKQQFQTDVLGGQNRGGWRLSNRPDSPTRRAADLSAAQQRNSDSDPTNDASPAELAAIQNRPVVSSDYFAPEYRYTTDRDEERERLGGSVGIAFRPSDATEIQASWFHSDLEILTQEASIKFPFASESPGLDQSLPYSIDGNGVLVNGTIIANSAEAISFVKNTDITSDNFHVRFKFDDGGALRASAAGAYSQAEQDSASANNDVRYTQYGVRNGTDAGLLPNGAAPPSYRYTYHNRDGVLPGFSLVGTPDLYTNPANGFFKSHWVFGDKTEVENWSMRGDVEFDPPFIEAGGVTLSGGIRLANRKVDYEFGRYLADYHGRGELDGVDFGQNWTGYGYFQDGAIGYKSCELPGSANFQFAPCGRFGNSPALITPYQTFNSNPGRVETINGFWGSGMVAGNRVLVQDRSQMGNPVAWIQSLYPDTPFVFFSSPLESFEIEERTRSAYFMADVGEPADRFHINLGARVLRTELIVHQNAALPEPTYWGTDSWNGVLRSAERNRIERTYTDILPSANVVLDVSEDSKVRFSAARVVARQDLFQLGRGFATDFTRNPVTDLFEFTNGSSGNPELEPYRATQFDLGYELYFGTQGLVSVAGFWKEVDSFITEVTESVFVNDQAGGRFGPVTRPINGEGGSIKGLELGAQYAFDWGGGFNVNYTYSDSESPTENDIDTNLPIPGVSEHAFNAQIYYQNFGFEARLSYSWRDKFFDGNFGFADNVLNGTTVSSITRTFGIWQRDYGQLDAQLGYQITDWIGVTLEAINITEEDRTQYLQYENLPFQFESGSRRILLGVRGRFGGPQ